MVLIFVLCPLMFTGCVTDVANDTWDKIKDFFSEEVEPTYYVGGLYAGENLYVMSKPLYDYTSLWNKYASDFLDDFNSEFNSKPSSPEKIIRGVKNRTDYFPDYKTLLGSELIEYGSYGNIASFLDELKFMSYYNISTENFVLALSSTDEVGYGTPFDSYGNVSETYMKIDDNGNAVANEDGLMKYYDPVMPTVAKGDMLFAQNERGYKVYYGNAVGVSTASAKFILLIGNKKDFCYNTYEFAKRSNSNNFNKRVGDFVYALYDTHYNKMNWVLRYDILGTTTYGAIQFKYDVTYQDLGTYRLVVEVIKDCFFGGVDGLKNCVPTAISPTYFYSGSSVENIFDSYSGLGGNNEYISKITLYEIYQAIIASNRTGLVVSSDGKEKIQIINRGEDGYLEMFFVYSTYQFLYGMAGIEESSTNYTIVANAFKNFYQEDFISQVGEENSLTEWETHYFSYIAQHKKPTLIDGTTANLKAIASNFVNNDKKLMIDYQSYQNVASMSVTTELAIAESDTSNQLTDDEKKQEENDSGKKTTQKEYDQFFTTTEKRKYYSFTFEAWGKDYSMDSFIAQFKYLTDEEEEALGSNEDLTWQTIRDHYTFVIQKCSYDKTTKKMRQVSSWAVRANNSELISESDLESGYIFLNFSAIFNANKSDRDTSEDITSVEFNNLLAGESDESNDKTLRREQFHPPFATSANGDYFYVKEYSITLSDGSTAKSLVYDRSSFEAYGEEFIQIIFAVDSEAYRVPLILKSIL